MRLAISVLIAACLFLPSRADEAIGRGRYLAVLGDCAGCHTKPNGPAYAGGLSIKTPFGTIYSTNITPDRDTGLGKWTEADFYRALHDGIAPGGKHLYPAFPYIYFRRITQQDTSDLFAYLRSLKPIHREPTPNKLMFPMNLRFGLVFWNLLYFDKTPPRVAPRAAENQKRGDYLVNGLGHCAACHTPKTLLFGDESDKALGGGVVDHWFANSLAGGQTEGLGRWSQDELVQFLATGVNRHATAAGPMLEKVTASTGRMTAQDRAAIATYLKSLPPQKQAAFEPPRREQMARGRGLYLAHCQSCHAADGHPRIPGPKAGYPSLAGDTLVMGRDPTTVLRIILTGGTAPALPSKPPVKPMPAFSRLDDGMIGDLATYVRNAWGNSAPVVDATQVHALRQALKD
jgi:mono/diheme cytochrome c family protein